MLINFECRECRSIFDCDVGTVTIPENSDRPNFEKEIVCPECGQLSMDEVLLTELGESQLTEATLDFDFEDIFDSQDDQVNGFGFYEGECQGCDVFSMLNDFGLCEECAGKYERDLIRQLDWEYSALAYACPESKREGTEKRDVRKKTNKSQSRKSCVLFYGRPYKTLKNTFFFQKAGKVVRPWQQF